MPSLGKRLRAFRCPVRRRQIIGRIVESLIGLAVFYGLLVWVPTLAPLWALVAILAEFFAYEWPLEVWFKVAGPYWERGPRDGETFKEW